MSDLSFLIENQKKVVVDESYFQKCRNEQPKTQPRQPTQVVSAGNIAVNPNYVPSWKNSSPRSFNLNNNYSMRSEAYDTNEEMFKISMRVNALDENQRRLEQRFTKQFSNLHEVIFKKKGEYGDMMNEIKAIQAEINQSKKIIGTVLNQITTKK